MAKFYGKDSSYLRNHDGEYFLWAVGVVVIPLIIVILLKMFVSATAAAAVAVLALLFLLKWSQPLIYYFKNKSNKYYKGRFGEKNIKKELRQLSDDYAVFEGVVLDKSKGDIDFVLIGPQGVLALEVKSLGGKIAYNGSNLTINGKEITGKNFLQQAFGEARAVGLFLRSHLDFDIYVKPVLIFSSDYASMEFGLQPQDNVYVIQKEFLFTLLASFPNYEWQKGERAKVEALLRVTVRG